jgi:subtilisin-like proprotein convertase family protein
MLGSLRGPRLRSSYAYRSCVIALVAVSAFSLSAFTAAGAVPQSAPGGLSDGAAAQIAALQKIKASLSPAERKLDSRLAVAMRQRMSKAATAATPKVSTGVVESQSGTTTVDVAVTAVSADLLHRLADIPATVTSLSKRAATLRVAAPLTALGAIASWGDVRRVSIAATAMTAHETQPPVAAARTETKEERAARIDAQLKAALVQSSSAGQGAVVSEGDRTHAAATARTRFKVTGTGVKVCVLSDGVDSLATVQQAGELPVVDVLPGQSGSGDEGTAMLEIVHDLAPNATLGFATAFVSDSSFADNIRDLRFVAHCNVIVDDVIYFNEDPFQDGPIAQSVNAVTADGAVYFSSAGNEGNTIDRTSGNFESDFVNSGQAVGKFAGAANDFDPGPGVQVYEPISPASSGAVPVTLFWADPWHAAADDYDLYLFDSNSTIVAFSQDVQNGTQDPFEILRTPLFGGTGLRLAVVKFSGADRYFQLTAFRGRFSNSADGLIARVTPGVTRGHSAAVNAFSVAAAPAAAPLPFDLEPGDPPNPSGPFPNAFTKGQKPERFTSDGPRRVFFNADGSPITPGNFTSTGGTVRQKPDVTAADGVSTSLSDFSPFFGTSAAAPHAAAIAALVLSGNPGASTALIRQAFNATALDLAPPGIDNRSGHGIVRADRVLANTGATPQPLVVTGNPAITVTSGDGDAFLEPGETASMSLPVTNIGDGQATGVSVRVISNDPLVTVSPTAQSYGNVAAGASKTKAFRLALASSYPRGKRASLAVTVTFAGVLSPTASTLSIATGQPAAAAATFAYVGAPVPIPDADSTGVSVPISVSGIGYAAKLTLSIDGQTCTTDAGATTVGIDHTYISDLVGTLTSPTGRTATLFSRSGGSGNNLCQVVFDDGAAQPFAVVTSDLAPYSGTWRPADPLGPFLDSPIDGTWTFAVADLVAADTGSIRAVSLHITGFSLS